jgi:hypothetical protein
MWALYAELVDRIPAVAFDRTLRRASSRGGGPYAGLRSDLAVNLLLGWRTLRWTLLGPRGDLSRLLLLKLMIH